MLTTIVQRVVQTFAQVKVQKTNINASNLLLFAVPLQSENGFRFRLNKFLLVFVDLVKRIVLAAGCSQDNFVYMDARTLFLWMFFFHLWLNLFDFFQFLYLVFFHISIKSVSPEILSGFVYDNSAEA